MLTGAATVLAVRDMTRSIAYYRDALGFPLTFQYGDPVSYACFCRDEVNIHLALAGEPRLSGHGGVCIFVRDVDAIHAELVERGAKVVKPPEDYDYGMRDFDVLDLDGNRLIFGMASAKAEA
jgi:catechol 2,3-dioxygenase-like lactoylglutathione lyase family enzyme